MDHQTQMQSPNERIRIAAVFFLATAFILYLVWIGSGPGTLPNRTCADSDKAGLPVGSMWPRQQPSAAKNKIAGPPVPQGDVYLAAHITFRVIASAVLGGDEAGAVTVQVEK